MVLIPIRICSGINIKTILSAQITIQLKMSHKKLVFSTIWTAWFYVFAPLWSLKRCIGMAVFRWSVAAHLMTDHYMYATYPGLVLKYISFTMRFVLDLVTLTTEGAPMTGERKKHRNRNLLSIFSLLPSFKPINK